MANDSTPKPPAKASDPMPKSTGVTLRDAASNTLRLTAVIKKDGTAQTYAVHRQLGEDGKTKSVTRGATEQHPDMETARKALERLKKKAITSGGWQERAASGRGKPDAFDVSSLPAAKTK